MLNYEPWSHYTVEWYLEHGYDEYEAEEHANRYDKSNSAPVDGADLNGLLVGLELEISDVRNYNAFNRAIDNGLLETKDSGRACIQLEEEAQHSVEYELVFNADEPVNIKARLEELNGFISGAFSNQRDTSAHVHINRNHLDNIGVSEIAFYKACESIAPFIYAISGRDSTSWRRWTRSNIDKDLDIIERFNLVDNIAPNDGADSDDRYELCNVQNTNTIEVRGFSNYYDNDYGYISAYIDVVTDLIPEIALYVGSKNYSDSAVQKGIFERVERFINNHGAIRNFHGVEQWIGYEERIRALKRAEYARAIERYNNVQNWLNRARQYASTDVLTASQHLIEALKNAPDLKPDVINLNNILETINAVEDANQKLFKNTVWRI